MSELIRMKALRAWRNEQFEGAVNIGQEFNASFDRARELERGQLAVRVAKPPLAQQTQAAPSPLPSGDHGRATQPLSSPPARAQQVKTSRKFAGAERS